MTDLSSQYNFTLTTPALLTATTNAHAVSLYRGHTKLVSGDPISRAIPAGRYSVVVTGRFNGATATLGVSRTAAPTRLQADVWGGGAIHLNGDDNSSDETGWTLAKDMLSSLVDPVTVGQEQSLTDLPDPKP